MERTLHVINTRKPKYDESTGCWLLLVFSLESVFANHVQKPKHRMPVSSEFVENNFMIEISQIMKTSASAKQSKIRQL
jgi:hypothetical protein